jgi:type IV secretory pathway VirB10-like protein
MAVQSQSQVAKIARWKLLEARLRERLAEMPHLTEAHGELHGIITEAEALESQYKVQRVTWRKVNERRRELAELGETMRTRLSGALLFELGPKNQQIEEFGFKLRVTGRPRRKEEPEPEPTKPDTPAKVKALPPAPPEPPAPDEATEG